MPWRPITQADSQAEALWARLRAGERPEEVTETAEDAGSTLYEYTVPISQGQELRVSLRLEERKLDRRAVAGGLHRGLAGGRGPDGLGRRHEEIQRSRGSNMADLRGLSGTGGGGTGASDLFIVAGGPVSCKQNGKLVHLSEGRVLPDDTAALIKEIYTPGRTGR